MLAHFQRLFGRSNRDVFLENEGKVYAEAVTRGALDKKGVLRNFVKFTGKHQCQGLFFNKRLRIATSRFRIKCLKIACEILFILSGG